MDPARITPEWLREQLSNARGDRARLAEALGISPEKVSRMLSGERRPQLHEVAIILTFFGIGRPGSEDDFSSDWKVLTPDQRTILKEIAKAFRAQNEAAAQKHDP